MKVLRGATRPTPLRGKLPESTLALYLDHPHSIARPGEELEAAATAGLLPCVRLYWDERLRGSRRRRVDFLLRELVSLGLGTCVRRHRARIWYTAP